MSALGKVVRSGVGRRRVQTLVIGLATMMAVAASVLGGTLLVVSGAPFDDAFAGQHGAHLSVEFDAGEVSAGQLARSRDTGGVSDAAGPFRTATVTPRSDGAGPGGPMTVVGRGDPGRAVDEVALLDGRWPTRSGEIALSADSSLLPTLGMKIAFSDLPGGPALTVVGVARSVTRTADAWVVPSQMPALTGPDSGGYQMLYRFTAAGTAARITAGTEAVTRSLPPGAAVGETSWLTVRKNAERDTALYVPFLIAFGTLGLVMSVLIVGNVVASAVGTATRRIGILKAVGFTPSQVVRAYVGQALIPAAGGTALGVLAGHLLAVPVLAETEEVYGAPSLTIAPWVDLAVIAGVLGLVAVTAWASAWRAGRLRTVDALAVGRGASAGRGRWAARLAGRLPLPQPVALGLARPFARPARALAMGTAILFGAVAVTFTVGMGASLGLVMKARAHDAADVVVPAPLPDFGPQGPDTGKRSEADPAAVAAVVEAAAGTGKHYSAATIRATVSGLTGTTDVIAFTGDASWGGYTMVSGRWIDRPGEAVVPTPFLAATGTRVGDTVTLNGLAQPVTVRIVGEVLDPRKDGMQVFADASTLTAARPDLTETSHHIAVTPGTDVTGYVDALNKDLAPLGATAQSGGLDGGSDVVVTLNALSMILTLMLVAVAALGVFNGVLLDTRERVREIGVHKALGMAPRQTVAMVLTSVVVTGLAAGALGVPLGVALHGWVLPAMGDSVGLRLPGSVIAVYEAAELLPLALGGLLIAALGALLPAGWAAGARTATALRTE
ncbi:MULTISPECIES: FtsX-like permease family protein [Streptomyces]|uniref:FtsX-like permease family protein n=1 Tax=Streptomyces koelreuteriae TaxID=2838015 RepID=A0ABX8FXV7_9ACTN|nr:MULTISPECIES: FtsX-like permease family protein [Streptomyces]QWB26065.1 FtsX-like permease family protein [Streptomyces koelreuteriae]UUA09139.1 FtsX-like permease family protein [Streptomyces koelreuteriae]UUA16744.1 FtsX-like permease family protein [Streptomyces sp. CRCS-T-1]